jgi:hypothetical protein
MTGSGKTGLVTVMVEEALRNRVPVLVIDIKGDLPNLLLSFPTFSPIVLEPWIEPHVSATDTLAPAEVAQKLAAESEQSLAAWSIGQPELAAYHKGTAMRVITPGSSAGEMLHVLSSLERRSDRCDTDRESVRASLSAAVSLLSRLLGRDPDPAKSKEHVLLSVLAERRLLAGQSADLGALLEDLAQPPMERIGALDVNDFLPKCRARKALASSPTQSSVLPRAGS